MKYIFPALRKVFGLWLFICILDQIWQNWSSIATPATPTGKGSSSKYDDLKMEMMIFCDLSKSVELLKIVESNCPKTETFDLVNTFDDLDIVTIPHHTLWHCDIVTPPYIVTMKVTFSYIDHSDNAIREQRSNSQLRDIKWFKGKTGEKGAKCAFFTLCFFPC